MDSRRDFIKKAGLLAGAMFLPDSVQRAMAINPADGSTVWDADHVVILMQENRSFDHSYGTLRGVRGFNDPRAVQLPNGNKVWLQTSPEGKTFVPFRLDIKDTKATWMRGLPHSWTNQVEARNNGKYDKWLLAKPSGNEDYKHIPLTLGYYERQDIPFYYAFADAFTVCDQNFSSSLTGTTANRNYLWTGTTREKKDFQSKANVENSDVTYGREAHWKTFPERLEEVGVDWKVYQNELSLPVGFEDEEESWLANFTDNNLEWYDNYQVRFHPEYRKYLQERIKTAPAEIEALRIKAEATQSDKDKKNLAELQEQYKIALHDLEKYTPENFKKLPEYQQSIHKKAFTTNRDHKEYHQVQEVEIEPGTKMVVPKGDVLYQFRKDVNAGKLPPVSWLVAPQNFSDHPSAPWYGAWYVSEVLDILTKNPEVWKKTVFILCYDENDGYYDHVPPFVAPYPGKPETGKTSAGVDPLIEQVNVVHEQARKRSETMTGPIGLGYRVPLVIASPWSRGGKVCSEVFDHTSILQFLEKFVAKRYKKTVLEDNITDWRRAITGDLSSVFTKYKEGSFTEFANRDEVYRNIRMAKEKALPTNFRPLTEDEINQINQQPEKFSLMPVQEKGIKPAMAIPYELLVNATGISQGIEIDMTMGTAFDLAGVPFFINSKNSFGEFESRHYTVLKNDALSDQFVAYQGIYDTKVHGPNGFYRSFKGRNCPLNIKVSYPKNRKNKPTGDVEISIDNRSKSDLEIILSDVSYHNGIKTFKIKKNKNKTLQMDLAKSFNWYDFTIKIKNNVDFEWQYAGHVETGKESFTDPKMGKVL